MKAAQISAHGGQDAVKINQADKPQVNEGQVLVEVAAAGVNPFDVKVRDGIELKHYPATLGGDVAGTVAEVGPGVEGFTIGEEVYGQANAMGGEGSFAEFTPVKATQLAAKPKSIDMVTASALPLVTASAYQAIVEHMHLQPGQKILIHGGGGGIGSMAIQIAKNIGAYIATTARHEEADFVKGLGADEFIDYETQDFSQLLKDYDAVYDTVGGETTLKSYTILKPGGSLVSMIAKPDETLVEKYGIKFTDQFTMVTTDKLNKIAELVDNGKLHANVDKIFPLDDAAEALEYLKIGHPRGKVVLRIKD